jgi:hypothetical protein
MDEHKAIFRTGAEAWRAFCDELDIAGTDPAMRAIYFAGMAAALSIAYHYGSASLRAEIKKGFVDG